VAALEDRIVQRAVAEALNGVYEEDFLGFSYGFRPGRGAHDALDALATGVAARRVNWIVDADIAKLFDSVSQEWLARFLEHRIGDKRILRLIQKGLKAGVLDEGRVEVPALGTGQGAAISPLLANVHLHYVLDLWAERWRRREARGDMVIVRYADDAVFGFQHETDARRFTEAMRDRLAAFALTLHPDRTRLIEFGRFAAANREKRGLGKPETFNFLGFTFICGKSRRGGFLLKRKSRSDRVRAELKEIKQGLRRRMHEPLARQGKWLGQAGPSGARLVQPPRRAHEFARAPRVPFPPRRPLAAHAQAAQSERRDNVGQDHGSGARMAALAQHPPPLARAPLRRQTPKVGAVCGNSARTVLCGGRSAMSVPTAFIY